MVEPVVFFDVNIGKSTLGRIKIRLFQSQLPKTCENFRQFCTGEYRENNRPLGYKNCIFHRVIRDKIVQSGDFISNNGLGSKTIYGSLVFPDEGFPLKHEPFMVSMANSGPNTNGCQFFICLDMMPELDGKHVVFGEVIEGQELVKIISRVTVNENNRPDPLAVTIIESGEM
ncbi:hypothetical protein DASC09_046060 [Saccharomycopsis crataegensis]|uniref:Peptidyl-prolyl cis-trans isomerase n=1 Tax=Saccharomycopsis crataegensis TaxID=43959 RepID=A0AAV5QRW3_9ASCO|nr:hypothetical protein DASC09_046060 [Saccharomycopsis crataegensis]